jgi:N-methylhydantoinase A
VTGVGDFAVGVDIGGTFTDLVGFNRKTREIVVAKARTTPRELSAGILDCVAKSKVSLAAIDTLFHGSTVVINAIIERKGAKTALLTTRGFRDVLEIGRGNRPANYDLDYRKPVPIVPRRLRYKAAERMAPDGSIVELLDADGLARVADDMRRQRVEALAICFLHAYANPAHEDAARRYLEMALPGVYVCASSEIAAEWREFERTSTTVMNAFVGPTVDPYVSRLENTARAGGFRGRFYLMQSSGGVMTAERARKYPVAMVESGPVAGMIGAAHVGNLIGAGLDIGFDMGGTTAKASLIEGGAPKIEQTYYVNGYVHGYPLQVPTIEVIEVGTGGGSLAWIDELGALKVGPRSAGSEPGPVCVGNGGTEPTVTDANVALGRINAARYLGGEMALDVEAARRAIDAKIARPLSLAADAAAAGILTIANSNMALAVRGITIEKGVDPRAATMVAFGGGGPLHAAEIARDIGIPRVVVPTMPSCFSALGMLLADLRHDLVRTFVRPFPMADYAPLNGLLDALRREGEKRLRGAGVDAADIDCSAHLDLRYKGQQWTLTTPVGAARVDAANAPRIRTAFNRLYEARFGHSFTDIPTEVVNARVVTLGRQPKPAFASVPRRSAGSPEARRRRVAIGGSGHVDCPIYRRDDLLCGDRLSGPAIVEERDSTTVVGPGDAAEIDERGFIIIHVAGRTA